ncbi:glycosyltransferase family 2 protein [Alkalihalophilus pseudofirmus]|uniref:4,4'-diaponeurosporenoate glycosyltransferase n=1 Tax=Alkalihalophilus pseudofirmus TaxID=79885 RepID=A0AAJ2L1K0_ALKPS|nr:glycosyltransferase family 2 protein [Alkalihalophilus pseudofirmus]MDV2885000.1 glycosyltransferase family 2 protein [Alkalihalophilus pseudofirmus]
MIMWLLLFTCLFWLIILIDAVIGMRKIDRLEDVSVEMFDDAPLISIIIAARNEETGISASLYSQIKQSYPALEWIVVNDRSTDRTREHIESIRKKDARITSIHIKELPQGWLGKNHALYQGYKKAKGDYLLFTDADIIYQPDTIEKAMNYVKKNDIDHLTLAPNMNVKRFWPKAFISFFLFGFSFFKRPWMANVDASKSAIGIGAFNLVSKEAYESIGGHQAIKERPDDDLMLGVLLKQKGYKQRMVTALNHLEVEWYATLKEAFVGLEKNTLAGLYYRYSMVALAVSGVFITHVLPFLTLFSNSELVRMLSILSIVLIASVYMQTVHKMTKGALKSLPVLPVTALLFIYCIARAAFLTAYRGGIVWRGTFYSIKELRQKN